MNDLSQYSNRLQFYFWSIFCGQKVNFKWRSYQADRPLVSNKWHAWNLRQSKFQTSKLDDIDILKSPVLNEWMNEWFIYWYKMAWNCIESDFQTYKKIIFGYTTADRKSSLHHLTKEGFGHPKWMPVANFKIKKELCNDLNWREMLLKGCWLCQNYYQWQFLKLNKRHCLLIWNKIWKWKWLFDIRSFQCKVVSLVKMKSIHAHCACYVQSPNMILKGLGIANHWEYSWLMYLLK